ncbi:NAD(P)-dependent oxidoreductase [Cupriavidus taiwanensis]|uniref:3-hydroxyisobutyrate dehydrogenase family protein n=1 Tax=Cupriavidus taiwanensis (strain DSM 17343 / BCRC 17206 / CCUG 44338 / CIP 107171 / LMG 19424 / R1) TaxID=977880 RepID=B3RD25_CUPTR|nr:NAD(P)-dependent oxidoreductase [Cupriavidus taiwanensis]CAQ72800.1 Putative 3-hydroxyisobutyrate dehydrogenase family protein [Cupriavidus taiwanensis LMG 19424]
MSAASTPRTIVGFVGLGQMGKPMALNLAHDDTDLLVTSKVRDAYPELHAAGARTIDGVAGLAGADIVFLSLPGTAAVLEVLFSDGGLASHLRPGSIVVDTSTIEHGATMDIHARLRAAGIEFLDAPVSGMQSRAEAGTLTVMCGGAARTFEAVKPWLERLGNNILYMGEAGSGQLAKLVNQLLFDIHCAALAEILPMSRRMGLDPEKVASVINSGTGRSYASEFFLPRILGRHFSDGYPLNAAYKDLVSAAELGARHCIPMPVLAAATATYQMSLLAGHGTSDKGAMTRFFEDMLAVQFSAAAPYTEKQHG